MTKKTDADDPRYHHEIWSGPSSAFGRGAKAISYVENHNAPCGYAELTTDFGGAADLMIEEYRRTQLGNWTAPLAHVARQLVELHLKALMEIIKQRDRAFDDTLLGGHNLQGIWQPCRSWLVQRGYRMQEDARLEPAETLIEAFHAIDPSGDLFRFGISRRTAFAKQKSYDRVGIEIDQFEKELNAVRGLLGHWEGVVCREIIKEEMGWTEDPYFDPDGFPRRSEPDAQEPA